MKRSILRVGLMLLLTIDVMSQQPNTQATPLIQESPILTGQRLSDSGGGCIASVKSIPFDNTFPARLLCGW